MDLFDFRTFVFAIGIVKLITGVLTMVARAQAPEIPGSKDWAIGSFIGATALLLLSRHPVFDETTSLVITNSLTLIGEIFYLSGVRRLKGKPTLTVPLMIIPFISVTTVILTTAIWYNPNIRLFVNSALFGYLLLMSGLEWRHVNNPSIRTLGKILSWTFIIMSVMLGLRMGLAVTVANVNHLSNAMPNVLVGLIGNICQTFIVFGFILVITTLLAESLRQQVRMRDRLFSLIAHDLRNPVGTLMGMTELLEEGTQTSASPDSHLVSLIRRSAAQAYDLLTDLLEWGLSQQTSGIINPQPTLLGDLVMAEVRRLEDQARHKQIRIAALIEANPMVNLDQTMITAVLRNLITNAIKFTPLRGGIIVSVQIHSPWAEVTVRDTGVGMTQDVRTSLFQPDNPISTNGTEGERGTGLGLILCKDFVRRHGGELTLESTVGTGSRFMFTLPIPATSASA